MAASAPSVFADRLILRTRALGHPLCVGLDPHPDRLPACFSRGPLRARDPLTADVVENFLCTVIDRLVGRVAAVKPQIAFFEQLGWRGLRALERVVAHARSADLSVVLDAKRGDIGSTAAAYGAAYLTPGAALPIDALTVHPYLGIDSLAPLVATAQAHGRGLFVLVKTSNPGAGALQDLRLDGRCLYQHVAASLRPAVDALEAPETVWSSLRVVVGATYPRDAEQVRSCLPRALFLVPGFGAQGAGASDAVRGFVRGPGGRREGGLVNSARAILFPPGSESADRRRYSQLLDDAVERAADVLAAAVSA